MKYRVSYWIRRLLSRFRKKPANHIGMESMSRLLREKYAAPEKSEEDEVRKDRQEGIRVLQMLEDIKTEDVVFTCDDCKYHGECEYAFDPYNTNGDCLASK